MSYCRFSNTSADVEDCIEALENRDISSNEEKRKAKRMIDGFLSYCLQEGIIDDFDPERIDEIIEECK
ncbi:hypothetical protein D3C84_1199590 [compost metagenome]